MCIYFAVSIDQYIFHCWNIPRAMYFAVSDDLLGCPLTFIHLRVFSTFPYYLLFESLIP